MHGFARLDPFRSRILRRSREIQTYISQGFWNQVIKESYNTVILCLECLVMDHVGVKVIEQLKKESKIYLDPLINCLKSKGIIIKFQGELEKLRYFRNKVEHEHEDAQKQDAEWAFHTLKCFLSEYYPEVLSALHEESKEEKISVPGSTIKVADEVWIGCALLHNEYPDRKDFNTREIVERIKRENISGVIRPGVFVHINLHCVANKAPNPAKYRILYETEPGRRRLFKKGDYYHPQREGGKTKPNKQDIPEKYWYLLDWYENEYNK
jgi:hypothetical protein